MLTNTVRVKDNRDLSEIEEYLRARIEVLQQALRKERETATALRGDIVFLEYQLTRALIKEDNKQGYGKR